MAATQGIGTIQGHLAKGGVARDDLGRQSLLAMRVRETGHYLGENEIVRLRAHFAEGYVGGAADEALEESLLDGSWVRIDQELRALEHEQADQRRRVDGDTSGMRWVTEANPYGWAKPEAKRGQDHARPGEWNPYRQARNVSAAEAREHGLPDCRVRGCTRWEVTGNAKSPSLSWEPGEVDRARGEAAEPQERSGEVYGE